MVLQQSESDLAEQMKKVVANGSDYGSGIKAQEEFLPTVMVLIPIMEILIASDMDNITF